jgi:hypothetical protein
LDPCFAGRKRNEKIRTSGRPVAGLRSGRSLGGQRQPELHGFGDHREFWNIQPIRPDRDIHRNHHSRMRQRQIEQHLYDRAKHRKFQQFRDATDEHDGPYISYNLYTTSAHSTIWGDGTGGSITVTGSDTTTTKNYTIYGQLPTPQGVTPNTYTDTITVTVTY